MSKIRYCPCCALAGRDPYTYWKLSDHREYCENDYEPSHYTKIGFGAYYFVTAPIMGQQSKKYSDYLWQYIDRHSDYKERHFLLLKAMEAEAESDIFDPDMWITFPKKTETLLIYRAMRAALTGKLPLELIHMIRHYV